MATIVQQTISQTKPNDLAFTAKVNIVVPRHIFVSIKVAPSIVDGSFFSSSSG